MFLFQLSKKFKKIQIKSFLKKPASKSKISTFEKETKHLGSEKETQVLALRSTFLCNSQLWRAFIWQQMKERIDRAGTACFSVILRDYWNNKCLLQWS